MVVVLVIRSQCQPLTHHLNYLASYVLVSAQFINLVNMIQPECIH